jgi:hypothetical protein
MVTEEDTGNSYLPGRTLQSMNHLRLDDREAFLKEVPELIEKLRMREPAHAFELNLSSRSLLIIDAYIATVVDAILAQGGKIHESINRELVKELTAYVGEVIVRSRNGRWFADGERGPLIVFLTKSGHRQKTIDIYDQMIEILVEGESVAHWYELETE